MPGEWSAGLVAQSCVDGTVNAFLTLRIGCLASGYCASMIKPSTRSLRRTATVEAAGMLGSVARGGSERVGTAMWDAAKRTSSGTASVLANAAKSTLEQVSAAAQRLSETTGARNATAFLVQLMADTAAKTSSTLTEMVFGRWKG
jgi:hypothetical protein